MVSKAMVSETINTKTAKGIEGNNCTIRHRVRRAFRRSCNFPKKLENHFKAFDLAFFDVA
jgi:IS1 family transposase